MQTYIRIAILNRVGRKFWLDSTAVDAVLVQDLSDAVRNRHVVRIPRHEDMDRGDYCCFCQLPDVQLHKMEACQPSVMNVSDVN